MMNLHAVAPEVFFDIDNIADPWKLAPLRYPVSQSPLVLRGEEMELSKEKEGKGV